MKWSFDKYISINDLDNYYMTLIMTYCKVLHFFKINYRARIPAKHVYYYRCPDHRKNYVMSFSFCFDKEDDLYQFGYCYPYSYTRLQNYLDNLEKKGMDFFHRELLCLTVVSQVCVNVFRPRWTFWPAY